MFAWARCRGARRRIACDSIQGTRLGIGSRVWRAHHISRIHRALPRRSAPGVPERGLRRLATVAGASCCCRRGRGPTSGEEAWPAIRGDGKPAARPQAGCPTPSQASSTST